ncbi:unnamed protein product [Spirodela intermedia]|uniref:Protein kinase domain-containing protein n=1 Tax=Spirodela intermedia TaxID=51605 RepID=A0A7I8IP64_SPIIN|nr:unnamed protein product [Spirodela intermedia]CAA6659374.1 unnamed protein product [Spirodela intermedia]
MGYPIGEWPIQGGQDSQRSANGKWRIPTGSLSISGPERDFRGDGGRIQPAGSGGFVRGTEPKPHMTGGASLVSICGPVKEFLPVSIGFFSTWRVPLDQSTRAWPTLPPLSSISSLFIFLLLSLSLSLTLSLHGCHFFCRLCPADADLQTLLSLLSSLSLSLSLPLSLFSLLSSISRSFSVPSLGSGECGPSDLPPQSGINIFSEVVVAAAGANAAAAAAAMGSSGTAIRFSSLVVVLLLVVVFFLGSAEAQASPGTPQQCRPCRGARGSAGPRLVGDHRSLHLAAGFLLRRPDHRHPDREPEPFRRAENILGQGGFGTVYKGDLHDGTKIAVKRMESGVMGRRASLSSSQRLQSSPKFATGILSPSLGYCLDGNERLLVYEYMPQGTKSPFWKKRLGIALDVARGVEYLHNLAHQSFIHRDLKPSNILLGDDMKAKVSDFGLVRLAPDGKCSIETRLAGTFGYLAPEYAVMGRVTTKADVFSFGVVVMELITGRKALDESQPEESVHLVTWFRRMQLNKETFRKAIDPTIDLDEETMTSPHQRPDMGHAVNVLSSLAELWKPADAEEEESYGIDLDMTLPQALKKWQACEEGDGGGATASFIGSMDNTQTSIPTRPAGFADSFTSADGR